MLEAPTFIGGSAICSGMGNLDDLIFFPHRQGASADTLKYNHKHEAFDYLVKQLLIKGAWCGNECVLNRNGC